MKRILLTTLIILATLFAGGSYIYFVGKEASSRKSVCNAVQIRILDSASNNIIPCETIMEAVLATESGIVGKPCEKIDLKAIEEAVGRCSEVLHNEVYTMANGTLRVDVFQRKAAIRLITEDGRSFYCDGNGYIFPSRSHVDVPMITGFIPLAVEKNFYGPLPDESREWMRGALAMMGWIESNEYWKNLFGHIYVNSDGDFVLYPVTGKEKFIFGNYEAAAEKFSKIEKYYRCIAPMDTASRYTVVNLKYKNQIICK